MLNSNDTSNNYKTVVLIGGELHNIQVVVEKDEHIFEAVISRPNTWETKFYKESNSNSREFVLQE